MLFLHPVILYGGLEKTMKNQEIKNEIDQIKTRLGLIEQTMDEFEEDLKLLFKETGRIRGIFKEMKNIGQK